ncbi:MAG: UPF0149 family protein [Proteobacteria bacterium]|nr:UPF0149 family protein [Pseudomonadota bacterium]
MTAQDVRPLSGQELDRLETFLEGDNPFGWETMPLDMLQGFLCGVASAPEAIAPEDWLPWAFGIQDWPDTRPGTDEWYELARRFYLQQIPALEGREDAALILYDETPNATNRFEYWCVGYLDGLEMAAEQLDQLGDPAEVDELLFAIRVLANAFDDKERAGYSEKKWRGLIDECSEELWPSVCDTYRYGNALRNRPTTVRHETPKAGRNDPCPCGSGKKFKNCCGKA